jgi:acylphosphatase
MRRRVIVRGRVQGVGFRWFVREHARTLRLAGWVKNLPDGMVELEVEGAPDKVAELMALIAEGPDGAVVAGLDEVQISEPAKPLPDTFMIER